MSANARKGPTGQKLTVTAPSGGYASGQFIDLKSKASGEEGWVGEVLTDITENEEGAVEYGHQVEMPKNTGAGESFAVGDKVYRDATTGNATATATNNAYAGRATDSAGTSDTAVWLQLAPAGG